MKKLATYALFILVAIIGVNIFGDKKAYALLPDNVPAPWFAPANIKNSFLSCDAGPNPAAQTSWISLASDATQTFTKVNPGTASVKLRYNASGIVCKAGSLNGLVSTTNGVQSTNPNIPLLSNHIFKYNYLKINGAYSTDTLDFDYFQPGGFTTTTLITINIQDKRINVKANPTRYSCVTNPGTKNFGVPTTDTDYSKCASIGGGNFTFLVIVDVPAMAASMVASCSPVGTVTAVINGSGPNAMNFVLSAPAGTSPQLGANGTYTFTAVGQPQDGVARTASGIVRDTITGQVISVSAPYTCAIPPPTAMCNIDYNGSSFEVGDSFNIIVNIVHTGPKFSPSITETATATVAGQPRSQASIVVAQGGSTSITLQPPVVIASAGSFVISGSITGTVNASCVSKTIVFARRPYARFYGNDVASGSGFGANCTLPSAKIDVFSRPNGLGSASQLGVSAEGSIVGLASMSLRDAITAPFNQNARSFANTGAGTPGNSGFRTCSLAYPTPAGLALGSLASLDGEYIIPAGSLAGGVVNHSIALYVNGDLQITGNITSNQAGWSAGNIPLLQLIVTGNIYIQPNVTKLDGVYVAKPIANGTKGRIYTCASGAGVPSTTVLLGGCNSQLVVTGSFVATHINFLRTLGSVRSGNSGESYTSANIAEVFRYSPEEFLAKSPLTNGSVRAEL